MNCISIIRLIIASTAFLIVRCTTMNMPVHTFMFDRNTNSQWTQISSVNVSGIHFDSEEKISGINSTGVNIYYINYILPAFGVGGSFTAFEPFNKIIPSQSTGGDAWWDHYNYTFPLSFILSLRLLHSEHFTFGINFYPISFPFIIGSTSSILTFHLPLNLDITTNMHFNPTLGNMVGWKKNYGWFSEWDIALNHSIASDNSTSRFFYSIALESYRGIYKDTLDHKYTENRPDFRLGLNFGYIFGSPKRRFGSVHGHPNWKFTWPQPGHREKSEDSK